MLSATTACLRQTKEQDSSVSPGEAKQSVSTTTKPDNWHLCLSQGNHSSALQYNTADFTPIIFVGIPFPAQLVKELLLVPTWKRHPGQFPLQLV